METLEKRIDSYRLIINRPLTVDQETYRKALETYNKLNGEYNRRTGRTAKYSSNYIPGFN